MTRSLVFLSVSVLSVLAATSRHARADQVWGSPPSCTAPEPSEGQAFIYTDINYGGACYVLNYSRGPNDLRWASWDASTGFPNDQIRSVKNTGLTLVFFWNSFDSADNGAPLVAPPYARWVNLSSWNGQISAVRMQNFTYGNCLGSGTSIALFTDVNYGGDCTLLLVNGGTSWYSPVYMGFRNDTATSVQTSGTSGGLYLYNNASSGSVFSGARLWISSTQSIANLGNYALGWNDALSGICTSAGVCN